jgi:hypothetical protein
VKRIAIRDDVAHRASVEVSGLEPPTSTLRIIDPGLSTTKFGDWAQQWLEANPAKRESTRALDELIIRRHLRRLHGRALGSISPSDIQRLVNSWSDPHNLGPCADSTRRCAPSSLPR